MMNQCKTCGHGSSGNSIGMALFAIIFVIALLIAVGAIVNNPLQFNQQTTQSGGR
jgi:hypothetical protein